MAPALPRGMGALVRAVCPSLSPLAPGPLCQTCDQGDNQCQWHGQLAMGTPVCVPTLQLSGGDGSATVLPSGPLQSWWV